MDSHYFFSQPQNLCPANTRYGTVREKCLLWQICQCKICMTCCLSNGFPSSLNQISGCLDSIIVSPLVQYEAYQLACTDFSPGWHCLNSAGGRESLQLCSRIMFAFFDTSAGRNLIYFVNFWMMYIVWHWNNVTEPVNKNTIISNAIAIRVAVWSPSFSGPWSGWFYFRVYVKHIAV